MKLRDLMKSYLKIAFEKERAYCRGYEDRTYCCNIMEGKTDCTETKYSSFRT